MIILFKKMINKGKKGQVMVFVIIALIIVGVVGVYFLVKGKIPNFGSVSLELSSVFDYYSECIKKEIKSGVSVAGVQGGHIDVPEYVPGSDFAPFSSELNFLGFPVPYWYYVSGNGVIKEQVPLMLDIERELEDYVKNGLKECDFDSFYAKGYNIKFDDSEPRVKVKIYDDKVVASVNSKIRVSKGGESADKSNYKVDVSSKFGKFYDIAKKIYSKEKKDAIFDEYGLDVLRLYAPVDGVELGCSGKVWKTKDVVDELKSGLEANIAAIKFKGNYYKLGENDKEYHVVDLGKNVDENVNVIYLRNMPTKIEINGDGVDDELMVASPVGIQEGLGVMGFCYSPYHFVYDLSFPVLVQIYDSDEMFEFPVVSVIKGNEIRKVDFSSSEDYDYLSNENYNLCEFMNQEIEVNLYDKNLSPVNGEISYQCFDQKCRLGKTKEGIFIGMAPGCLNGYLSVRGNGFTDKRVLFSSNKETSKDIILDREYDVNVKLNLGGKELDNETAIISFVGKDGNLRSASAVLPDVRKIKLSEGKYDISVFIYEKSPITIPESKKVQCQKIPSGGFLGFFGSTKEKCFDIVIPETKIDFALKGGGRSTNYILEDQLQNGEIEISVDELPSPKSLEQLQLNYMAFEKQGVGVL